MTVPGGITVAARGNVSIFKVALQPAKNRLWIEHAAKPPQVAELARELVLTGFTRPPVVEVNGETVVARPESAGANGRATYVIPLSQKDAIQ